MKRLAFVTMFALLVCGMAVAGDAETVTVEGKVMCAKCKLHAEGLDKCQNVLVVEADGEEKHFWLAANKANKEFGDVCMATPMVKATGTVSEKDGHTWLTASKIEKVEKG